MGTLAHAIVGFTVLLGPAATRDWRPAELRVARRAPVVDPADIRSHALSYLGRPYVSGGIGNPGFDCSGFTCRVFAESGYALPRVSRDQARAGRSIALDAIAAGDLLFFVEDPGDKRISHVGLYLGGNEMVHAASGRGEVIVSRIDRGYYKARLVVARRFLPDPGADAPAWTAPPEVAATELEEHDGPTALSPLVRLPSRLRETSLGPDLPGFGATSIAVRAAGVTERGKLGFVLAPEATLWIESIAFELIVAVPIRFENGRAPTLGEIESPGDAARFLRRASLGLPGADFSLRLDQLGDASLAGRMLVDRLQPHASGVPGLSVERVPLSFFAGYRDRSLELDFVIDDVTRPGVTALGARVPLLPGWIRAGAAVATDQRAELEALGRRAITGAEGAVFFDAFDTREFTLTALALGSLIRSRGEIGYGGALGIDGEWRLAKGGTSALGARLQLAHLGPRFLDDLFGPTYAASRSRHFAGLGAESDRASFGGEIRARFGRFSLLAGHTEPIGAGGQLLDRESFLGVALEGLVPFGTQVVDLRLSYAARGLFAESAPVVDVIHASARVRFFSWLFVEAYLTEADRLEGGVGIVAAWIP